MHRLLFALVACSIGCASAGTPPPSVGHPPLVPVEFHADNHASLERRWEGMPWALVCKSGCTQRLRPDFEYRVAGEGLVPSRTFYLQGPTTTITARTGHRDTHKMGVAMVSVGIPVMVIGSFLTWLAYVADSDSRGDRNYSGAPMLLAGVGAGLGALLTVGGVYALSTSSTTVEIRDGGGVAKYAFRF